MPGKCTGLSLVPIPRKSLRVATIFGRRALGLGRSRGVNSYGPISSADPGSSKSVERCEPFPPKVKGFHGNTSLAMSKPGTKVILNR